LTAFLLYIQALLKKKIWRKNVFLYQNMPLSLRKEENPFAG